MGRILEPGHSLVAGSCEDVVALLLAHDAGTPLRDVFCYVSPIVPPAKAYIIRNSEIGELTAQEEEMRKEKPHLFPRGKRTTWDGE